jgi:hypothetical protein
MLKTSILIRCLAIGSITASASLPAIAAPARPPQRNTSTTPARPTTTTPTRTFVFENAEVKLEIVSCKYVERDAVCQGKITSKGSDRSIEIRGNRLQAIDSRGNEFVPKSIRIANVNSDENNYIRKELLANTPIDIEFRFANVPESTVSFARMRVPIGTGEPIDIFASFRDVPIKGRITTPVAAASSPSPVISAPSPTPSTIPPTTTGKPSSFTDRGVCPPNRKIFVTSEIAKSYLFVCGNRNPSHLVIIEKATNKKKTIPLKFYNVDKFTAIEANTTYVLDANSFTISTNNRQVSRDAVIDRKRLLPNSPPSTPTRSTPPTRRSTTPR